MDNKLTDLSCHAFTHAIASKEAVPGGGGAAALVSAIGTALGDMVGELTLGKKKYAAVEEEIEGLMTRSRELIEKLLACVERDAEAFIPLSLAYKLPKEDAKREAVMEECLRGAAQVPLEIMELSCEALDLLFVFAKKGSRLAVSDAGCGCVFCRSAVEASYLNVLINTGLMKDRAYAGEMDEKAKDLLQRARAWAEKIFDIVEKDLRGEA